MYPYKLKTMKNEADLYAPELPLNERHVNKFYAHPENNQQKRQPTNVDHLLLTLQIDKSIKNKRTITQQSQAPQVLLVPLVLPVLNQT